jgi:AraC family transcriptional regulator of arabinose operon
MSRLAGSKRCNVPTVWSINDLVEEMRRRAERDRRVKACLENLLELRGPGKIDMTVVARRVNLSPSRLRHVFFESLGISPSRLLKLVRIKRANGLLNGSFLSVKEVMFSVGINDPSHFSRDYERMVGERPSFTRNRHREAA